MWSAMRESSASKHIFHACRQKCHHNSCCISCHDLRPAKHLTGSNFVLFASHVKWQICRKQEKFNELLSLWSSLKINFSITIFSLLFSFQQWLGLSRSDDNKARPGSQRDVRSGPGECAGAADHERSIPRPHGLGARPLEQRQRRESRESYHQVG